MEASATGDLYNIPLRISIAKNKFKNNLINEWQEYWNVVPKGRRTYEFINKVKTNRLIRNKYLTLFLTGHGPFLTHLKRFKKVNDDICECKAGIVDPDHYIFD